MLLLQTLVVYLGLVALMYYFFKRSIPPKNKHLFWIPILLYTLVFGMRYGVGVDYYEYALLYEKAMMGNTRYIESLEPSFRFLLYSCVSINIGKIPYMCILVFLEIVFLFGAFKNERYILPYLSVVIIFTCVAQMSYMNGMRQIIAWGMFVFSIKYIVEGKFLKYIVIILLASTFHTSALILLPVYFVKYIYKSLDSIPLQVVILIVFILLVLLNPLGDILKQFDRIIAMTKYSYYSTFDDSLMMNEEARSLGVFDILQFLVYFMIIHHSKIMKKYFGEKFCIMYFFFFIGTCASLFLRGSIMLTRLTLYFAGFDVVIYAYCWYYWKQRKCTKHSYKLISAVFSLIICLGFARQMYYSEANTTQFSFFFQDDFNKIKDKQFLKERKMPGD